MNLLQFLASLTAVLLRNITDPLHSFDVSVTDLVPSVAYPKSVIGVTSGGVSTASVWALLMFASSHVDGPVGGTYASAKDGGALAVSSVQPARVVQLVVLL